MAVLALVEQSGGLKNSAVETLSESDKLAGKLSKDLYVALIGESLNVPLKQLEKFNIQRLFDCNDKGAPFYSNEFYVEIVSDLINELKPDVIIGTASTLGKELCASIAGRIDIGLIQDCIEVEWNGCLTVKKPIFAGKVISSIKVKQLPVILTLRPNFFNISEANGIQNTIEAEKRVSSSSNLRSVVRDFTKTVSDGINLQDAKIVVSGGRGLGDAKSFKLIRELCDILGAALGASRGAVDSGWIHHSYQIGQTGKVVSPDVYIACGISGSIQHQAGMRTSKIIVAINKDPDAEIFGFCDYGIVGDLFEVIPKFIDELKEVKTE